MIQFNDELLDALRDYASRHKMSVDFVIAVAVDQFLADPDNHLEAERVSADVPVV